MLLSQGRFRTFAGHNVRHDGADDGKGGDAGDQGDRLAQVGTPARQDDERTEDERQENGRYDRGRRGHGATPMRISAPRWATPDVKEAEIPK